MKEQYIGDVNDYRKYALLRLLAKEGGVKVGVCWMLTQPDGRKDGGKLAYLTDTKRRWDAPDESLFNLLKGVTGCSESRCISELQKQQLIPRGDLLRDAPFRQSR